MAAEMEAARSLGFTPRYVNYTAANVLAAWRDTRAAASREAARGRDVYAYGFSAGGVLASLLAQKDRVLAAAAVAPPSNLTTWERNGPIWDYIGNPGPRTKRFLSPPFHPTANPITLYHSTEDPLSPFRANLLWARRDPKVRLVPVAGTHTTGDRHHAIARTALSWLGRFHRRVLAARAGRKAIGW